MEPTAEPRERIVCRREVTVGTNFKEQVCRYQWQLDEGAMNGRAALNELDFAGRRFVE